MGFTMTSEDTQIISKILQHIAVCGGQPAQWYVGVAEDARKQLEQHNVIIDRDFWMFTRASSSSEAETVVSVLRADHGLDGTAPYSNPRIDCVYVYRKNERTTP